MSMTKRDLIGEKFGKLTILSENPRRESSKTIRRFICRCECGTVREFGYTVLATKKASCGCSKNKPCPAKRKTLEIGERFGMLVVIAPAEDDKWGRTSYLFKCDCGTVIPLGRSKVIRGKALSCGCTHWKQDGLTVSKNDLYRVWKSMDSRCHNKNDANFKGYGGGGVSVCPEWKGPDGFKNFLLWAENNGYSKELRLDKDILSKGDKIYSPSTCKFVTPADNSSCKKKSPGKSSKYIGVSCWIMPSGKGLWRSHMSYKGKELLSKSHSTELEAAQYRENYIIEHNLPHTLNFPGADA